MTEVIHGLGAAADEPVVRLATAVVVGIGDRHRRDDGVGPAVVDLLAGRGLDATLVSSDGETSALVDLLHDRDLAFLIDTVQAEPSHPGRVHRLVVMRPMSAHSCAAGHHGPEVSRAMDRIRQSGRQPRRMVVFAIESADTQPGQCLSAPVAAAARRVADEIAAAIRGWELSGARLAAGTDLHNLGSFGPPPAPRHGAGWPGDAFVDAQSA